MKITHASNYHRRDLSFDLGEPERYRKDVPKAEVHIFEGRSFRVGHGCGSDCAARS